MAERLLRVAILLQSLGLACALVFSPLETEQDLYGLLYFDWDWPELVAQRIESWTALAALLAAIVVVTFGFARSPAATDDAIAPPSRAGWCDLSLLGSIALLQLLLAAAKTSRGDSFMSEWTVPEQATRWLAPLAVWWLARGLWGGRSPRGLRLPRAHPLTGSAAEWTLRVAAALTFFAHGIKAAWISPSFVSLILGSGDSLLAWSIPQWQAEVALQTIGVVDIALAVLIVTTRWRWVAWYMAVWGLVTALSRMTGLGWMVYPETLVRAANCGVPLALAILWSHTPCPPRERAISMSHDQKPTQILASLLLIAAFATVAHADAPLEGTKPAQWRVVWTGDPASSATVSWSTKDAGQSHRVRFGIRGEDTRETLECQRNGKYTPGAFSKIDLYYHHAHLTNLKPETAYEVELLSDEETSPKLYFVTAPSRDRPLSILFGGDSRSDAKARRQMNQLLANLVAQSLQTADEADDVFALAHGGDYILNGRDLNQWSEWLTDHELTMQGDGRLLPIVPARGNHDPGALFNEVFDFPPEHLNYYGVSLGPQVRLVTLNSETVAGGDQANWLDQELTAARPKYRWLLAQYHRPAYPAVKAPGDALRFWVPLFEKHNLDLVCEADGHVIKRTVPIRAGKQDATGVVYIGEGGLGVKQRTPKTDRWFLQSPGMAASGHHVQLLTFGEKTLKYQCIALESGTAIDNYERSAR